MNDERMTRKNPDGSFRIPAYTAGAFRMDYKMDTPVFFGEAVDRLGAYEELGTIEEIKEALEMKNRYGKRRA